MFRWALWFLLLLISRFIPVPSDKIGEFILDSFLWAKSCFLTALVLFLVALINYPDKRNVKKEIIWFTILGCSPSWWISSTVTSREQELIRLCPCPARFLYLYTVWDPLTREQCIHSGWGFPLILTDSPQGIWVQIIPYWVSPWWHQIVSLWQLKITPHCPGMHVQSGKFNPCSIRTMMPLPGWLLLSPGSYYWACNHKPDTSGGGGYPLRSVSSPRCYA